MKSIQRLRYGSPEVIELRDAGVPVPADTEVLIQTRAASINAYDWHFLTADIFLIRLMGGGLMKPKDPRLGADIAGVVTAVGKSVERFRIGDEVFGMGRGSFAEYACADEKWIAPKPKSLSFEEAAAVPMAATTALQGLRDRGRIEKGHEVLINGASGGVGTFALQIAKALGAVVTAVCSTGNTDQARRLGADHVIDYRSEDFTKSGKTYDLIFAANGYHPLSAYKRALSPRGSYVMAGGSMAQMMEASLLGSALSKKGGKTLGGVSAVRSREDLLFLTELIEAGRVAPVVERSFPLVEAKEALRYFGSGHARGKIVITAM
jgi:NADPH:quinone reductase-like Zn-dependent oxidoreductase